MTSTTQSTTVQARARDDTKSNQDPPLGSHDDTTLNSMERVVPDGNDQVSKNLDKQFIKCKKAITISSLNTRTLNPNGRAEELSLLSKTHNIDVICLQDHKFYHPNDDLKYHKKIEGQQIITVSCWKNSINASVGGVGFLLSTRAQECLANIEKISSRISVVEFNSKPKTTIISCYSPTNCSPEEEVDEFYSDLKSVCDNTPPRNLLLICGDFNAKLGKGDAQFSIHTETNRNSEKLADLLTEYNLSATNTMFMNKLNKLWTFQYPNGNKAQLDFILVRHKWINSVKNCRAYSSFDSILSDHRIVSARIQLSLRTQKKKQGNPMSQVDWPLVTSDSDLTDTYTVEVHNRFTELCPAEATPHEKYKLMSECSRFYQQRKGRAPRGQQSPHSKSHCKNKGDCQKSKDKTANCIRHRHC